MLHQLKPSRLFLLDPVAFSQTGAIFPKLLKSSIGLIIARIRLGSTGCVGYMGAYGRVG